MGQLQPVPLGHGAFLRPYAQGPEIRMENRFFEAYPLNGENGALLSRPGTDEFDPGIVMLGQYTALFAQPGVFGGDLFISTTMDGLYRYSSGGGLQAISGSAGIGDRVSFAASVGLYHGNLFIASETGVGYYDTRSRARAFIVRFNGPAVIFDQTVRIGSVYYKWRGASTVDAGSPAGTAANPYLLNHAQGTEPAGSEDFTALYSLWAAVNAAGTPGIDYSSVLTAPHPDVRADPYESYYGLRYFTALAEDASANLIELEVIGSNLYVGSSTGGGDSPETVNFAGGGAHEFHALDIPDDVAISKVVALNGYVLFVVEGSQQFYFLRPGAVVIDALDFFSAESVPDEIQDALAVGDIVWFFGVSSTEAWYATGDSDRPFQRHTGQTFQIGGVRYTAVSVNGRPIFVGSDNCVYAIEGAPRRISNHGIEERIRASGDAAKEAWTFSLDGHHFYVLYVEGVGTLVYDDTTGQWHSWYSAERNPDWDITRGIAWGQRAIGMDPLGINLYEVIPDSFFDSGEPIARVVTGYLPHRDTEYALNSFLRLYGSIGKPDVTIPTPPNLSLRFSDDGGDTWYGPITVELSTSERQDVLFRSLGRLGIPGRVFELSDTGGLVRIDGVYAQID